MKPSPETLKTIVMLAQSLATFRAAQLVATPFHLDARCQHMVRTRFRKLISTVKTRMQPASIQHHLPNGRLDGLLVTLHGGGTCRQRIYYINNIRYGYDVTWHVHGQLCSVSTNINDKPHGEFTKWFKTGGVCEHGHYHNGKRHGKYTEYHANGQEYITCEFVDGDLCGEYSRFSERGMLVERRTYKQFSYI